MPEVMRLSDQEKDEGSDAPGQADPVGLSNARPLRVLIVEDDEETRLLYFHYLKFFGARVTTAANGAEALQIIPADPPDVIVLDLALPRLTGVQVLETLKDDEVHHAIPVVVLSGQRMKDVALAAGADVYLEKPCMPSILLREVSRAFRDRRRVH